MAASTSAYCSLSSPSTLSNGCRALRQLPVPRCVSLPPARPLYAQKTIGYSCPKKVRNLVPLATGDSFTSDKSSDEVIPETQEFVKVAQEAWDKLEDKYAVTALAFAGLVGLWGSTGVISAIDRLPLVPGVLELVGIGYSGWFIYKNLVFKPDREALVSKAKCTYDDIIGNS